MTEKERNSSIVVSYDSSSSSLYGINDIKHKRTFVLRGDGRSGWEMLYDYLIESGNKKVTLLFMSDYQSERCVMVTIIASEFVDEDEGTIDTDGILSEIDSEIRKEIGKTAFLDNLDEIIAEYRELNDKSDAMVNDMYYNDITDVYGQISFEEVKGEKKVSLYIDYNGEPFRVEDYQGYTNMFNDLRYESNARIGVRLSGADVLLDVDTDGVFKYGYPYDDNWGFINIQELFSKLKEEAIRMGQSFTRIYMYDKNTDLDYLSIKIGRLRDVIGLLSVAYVSLNAEDVITNGYMQVELREGEHND